MMTIDCGRYDVVMRLLPKLVRGLGLDMTYWENAYASGPNTTASYPCMFSGTYPLTFRYGSMRGRLSFVEMLLKHGFITIGFPNNPFIGIRQGFNKGFTYYDYYVDKAGSRVLASTRKGQLVYRATIIDRAPRLKSLGLSLGLVIGAFRGYYDVAKVLTSKAISILSRLARKKPVFLWANFMDAHFPYLSLANYPSTLHHALFVGRLHATYISERYVPRDSELAKATWIYYVRSVKAILHAIRTLVEHALEILDDFTVLLTSDHGEELFEHGVYGHYGSVKGGVWLTRMYNELLHIPFVVMGDSAGSLSIDHDALLHHKDLPAIITELCGVKGPFKLDEKDIQAREHVVCEAKAYMIGTRLFGETYAIISSSGLKYVWHPIMGEALYDIKHGEQENLVNDMPEEARIFRRELKKHIKLKAKERTRHTLMRRLFHVRLKTGFHRRRGL